MDQRYTIWQASRLHAITCIELLRRCVLCGQMIVHLLVSNAYVQEGMYHPAWLWRQCSHLLVSEL